MMRRLVVAIRRWHGGDSGTSLVELLVAMIVVSLLGAAMVAGVANMTKNETTSNTHATETNQAQTNLDRMSHYLRASWLNGGTPSYAFTYAGANQATFYSDLGAASGPQEVNLYVTGPTTAGVLHEELTSATGTGPNYVWPATPTTARVNPGNVDTTSPVFTYYSAGGPNNSTLTPLTVPLTNAATSPIDAVRVTLTQRSATNTSFVTVSTLIFLRNAEAY